MQSQINGFAGTALGVFGSAQNGLPASIVAPCRFSKKWKYAARAANPGLADSRSGDDRNEINL